MPSSVGILGRLGSVGYCYFCQRELISAASPFPSTGQVSGDPIPAQGLPEHAWVFRDYADEAGHRVYRKKITGTVIEFPKRADAERHVMRLRVDINDGVAFTPMIVERLAVHFKNVEAPLKAYSTREGYKRLIDVHVVPKWGQYSLTSIKGTEVENWLRNLKRQDGKPASPASKSTIRNGMSAMYSHAIRFGWRHASPSPRSAPHRSGSAIRKLSLLQSSGASCVTWASASVISCSWRVQLGYDAG